MNGVLQYAAGALTNPRSRGHLVTRPVTAVHRKRSKFPNLQDIGGRDRYFIVAMPADGVTLAIRSYPSYHITMANAQIVMQTVISRSSTVSSLNAVATCEERPHHEGTGGHNIPDSLDHIGTGHFGNVDAYQGDASRGRQDGRTPWITGAQCEIVILTHSPVRRRFPVNCPRS